jgi:hypothetical protein
MFSLIRSYSLDVAHLCGPVDLTILFGTQYVAFIVRLFFDAVSSVELKYRWIW